MTGKIDVMNADKVSALRNRLEDEWFAKIERAVDGFLSAVIDDAVAAMDAATLTAAADPFAFTNVMSRWYDAVRLLAEDQGQSDAESIKWLLRESSLPERAFEQVSEILAQARDEGWTTYKTKRALSAELIPKETSGRWTSRAAYRGAVSRIARAMGTKSAAELVEDELREEGLPGKAWVAVMDERTRASHMDAHGQVVPLDGTFKVGGHELARPGDPAAPLEEIANCFPPGTLTRGQIDGAYRRWYEGELVEILTSDGVLLSGTPNHPVLTPCGWVRLEALKEGDDVLAHSPDVEAAVGEDVQALPASIEEVYDSLAVSRDPVRVSRCGVNFHGEIPDSDVDVVGTDRELGASGETPADQFIRQRLLTASNEALGTLIGPSPSLTSHERVPAASAGLLGRGGESGMVLGTALSGEETVGLRSASEGDAFTSQESGDSGSANPETLSEAVLGLPGSVTSQNISRIRRFPYTGHVYNLSTLTGAFTANNIIVHNCRCILVGGRQEDIDMTITASAALSSGWTGIIGMEKSLTGDGRLIADGALTWSTPVPLRYVQTDIGAHDGAQVVGVISNIWRGANGQIEAEGTFDLDSEMGREAARQVAEGLTTGISMDLDDVAFEVHVAEEVINRMEAQLNGDEPDAARKVEDGRVVMQEVRPDDEVHVMKSARVRAATIVAVPAFAEAKIGSDPSKLVTDGDTAAVDAGEDEDDDDGLDDDSALEEAVLSALEDEGLEASIDQDDPHRAAADTEQLNWVDDVGGLPSYIRRIADRLMSGGMSESRAIAVAVNTVKRWARGGSARGDGSGAKVSAKTIAKAVKALAEWEAKKARAKATAGDTITAAGGPERPPKEWFADPGLTEPTPITVQKDGRVFGHLATWDSCHIANADFCTSPPRSVTDYAYFHTGAIELEDGSEVGVGHLTLDTGHAEQKLRASAAMSHYDNTGTVAADVRAGEDAHGIWVAGSMRAGLSEKKVRAMRSAPLSGDWRRIQGNLELVAALAVNVPGFPIPRPQGLAASGHMQALVASGMLPPRKVRKPGTEGALSTEDLRYLKALARRERKNQAQALAARARAGKVHDFAKKVLAEQAADDKTNDQKEN